MCKVKFDMRPMSLWQYMLMPFGLSLKHKSIDYYFTGIVISIFSLLLITMVSSLFMLNPSWNFLLFKVLTVAQNSLFLIAYTHLKRTFEKLNFMYDEIQHFLTKYHRFGHPFTTPLILFVVFSCLFYTCTVHNLLQNDIFEKAMHPILSKLYYTQMPVSALFMTYWVFIINYLIFEFNYQYKKLLSFHNNIVKRNMDKIPIPMTRYFIEDSLKNFKINDNDMRITISMFNKINIILNVILLFNFLIIINLNNSYQIDTHFTNELWILVLLLELYFSITQYYIILQIKTQKSIIKNLLKWREKYVIEYNLKCVIIF